MFEAADYPGGHTNTIRVETERGAWNVDTGFIVFNDRNYPNFERLLDRLGVATQPADMSFSVADEAGRFEWASRPQACSRTRPTWSTGAFTGCSWTSFASTARPGR